MLMMGEKEGDFELIYDREWGERERREERERGGKKKKRRGEQNGGERACDL